MAKRGTVADVLAGVVNSGAGLPPSSPWAVADLTEILWPEIGFVGITRAQAMTVPACASARNQIAPPIGSAPLSEWSGTEALAPRTLLTQPDPDVPRAHTLTWTADDLIFHGVSYWLVLERDAASIGGRPRHARRIDREYIGFDADGVTPVAYDGSPTDPADWIIIPGPHEGVLQFGARELGVGYALTSAARRFATVPMPALELHDTSEDGMDDEDVKQLVADWQAARERSGTGYTNRSLELRTHGWNSAELQLVEARQHQALEVARVMGIRAAMVDASGGSSITYATLVDSRRDHVDFTLAPYADAITARLSMDDITERGRQVVMRLDATLLRASFSERMAAYAAAQSAGIYTADELRNAESGRPGEMA